MQAAVYTEYGSPDLLQLQEVAKPAPRDGEVLIKVRAASVNASDYELLTGEPLYARIWGLRRPLNTILGSDVAGRVEAVGRKVTRFQPGDAVFGDVFERWGGFAEYLCAPQDVLIHKPASMTFEQAAAMPQAAVVALQGLRDKGQLQPGQRVLINGAGGGAGTFAVQLAKVLGGEVTGVDSASKLELMRSIGADQVIDYAEEDFCARAERYDLILDFVASRSTVEIKRALRPRGAYVLVGGGIVRFLDVLLLGSWSSLFGRNKLVILGWRPNTSDLAALVDLFEAGKVVPVIDQCYPLSEVAEAFRYLGAGLAQGKVVITAS